MLILHPVFQAGILPVASFYLPTRHLVEQICNKNILQVLLEMEWGIACILRKLNIKETQRNHFCLCPVLPFLCVRACVCPCWETIFCGSCVENATYTLIPPAQDTGTEGCNSDCSLGYDHFCPLCSDEPRGAWGGPKN